MRRSYSDKSACVFWSDESNSWVLQETIYEIPVKEFTVRHHEGSDLEYYTHTWDSGLTVHMIHYWDNPQAPREGAVLVEAVEFHEDGSVVTKPSRWTRR